MGSSVVIVYFVVFTVVPSCPTFIQRPRNSIAIKGRPVKLECRTSGGTSIRWVHNGNPVREDGRVVINNTGALSITSVAKSDEGTYACYVFNRDCRITSSATLTVKGA